MTKRIFGYYPSEDEAINAVNGIALKGYRVKDITIFTNYSDAGALRKRTDVNIQSSVRESKKVKDRSFSERISSIFMKSKLENLDFHALLTSFGMSEEQVNKCLDEINTGKVLVIIEDDIMRVGHARLNEVVRPSLLNNKNSK